MEGLSTFHWRKWGRSLLLQQSDFQRVQCEGRPKIKKKKRLNFFSPSPLFRLLHLTTWEQLDHLGGLGEQKQSNGSDWIEYATVFVRHARRIPGQGNNTSTSFNHHIHMRCQCGRVPGNGEKASSYMTNQPWTVGPKLRIESSPNVVWGLVEWFWSGCNRLLWLPVA